MIDLNKCCQTIERINHWRTTPLNHNYNTASEGEGLGGGDADPPPLAPPSREGESPNGTLF